MNKIGITLLIAALLLSCSQRQKQTREDAQIKYYSKLAGIISPNLEYMGRGKIAESEAKSLDHYRFIYGKEGELSKIQYFEKNAPSDNSYYGTHEVKYHYEGDRIIRSYYDAGGQKAATYRHYYFGNNIHQEVFRLDEYGDKVTLILKDSLNNQIESELGSYLFTFEKVNDSSFIQKQFKKDGSPNVLTHYFPFYNTLITTRNDGFLYSIANVDPEGTITPNHEAGYAKVVFNFDEFGNELGWSFLNASNHLANRLPYLEMDHGFAKVVYNFNWKNKTLGIHSGFEEVYFNEQNEPAENDKGIHSIKYEYDVKGNFSGMKKFNLQEMELKQ